MKSSKEFVNDKFFEYALVEHKPCSEGGPNFFRSTIPNLEKKPELWEQECPYSFRSGRIVPATDEHEFYW